MLLLDKSRQHLYLVVTSVPGRCHHAVFLADLPAVREIGRNNHNGADSTLPCSYASVFRGVQVLALLLGDSPGNPAEHETRTKTIPHYPSLRPRQGGV